MRFWQVDFLAFPVFLQKSEDGELFRSLGDDLCAVFVQDHNVLDAHTELAGDVDSRLRADRAADGHDGLAGEVCAGQLVDIKAEGVAEAVAEVLAVAGLGDDVARGGVDLIAGDAGAGGGDTGKLRFEDDVVDVLHFVGSVADGDGSGHVGAVAMLEAAEVHGHEVALVDDLVAGDAMRHTGLFAGDDDGVEGVALAAVEQHAVHQLRRDLTLGHAGLDDAQHFRQRLFADGLRLAQIADLLLGLGGAQLGEYRLRGQKLHSQRLLIAEILGVAQLLLLGTETLHARFLECGLDQREAAVLAVEHLHIAAAGGGVGRGLDIAGVRDEPRGGARDNHGAVGEREAGGVALVLLVGNEHGVKIFFDQLFLNFFDVVHIPVSSGVGRGKLTVNFVPRGLFCPTVMLPPCSTTASCTILNPRPLPPASRERALSTL